MGRGNVCVHNPYEGLYFIDKEYTSCYYNPEEDCLIMGKEVEDFNSVLYDEFYSDIEYNDFIINFKSDFMKRFKSFTPTNDNWGYILENKLFYIEIVDNVWSWAIRLIQKDDYYLTNLQKKHYLYYLEGIKNCLFNQFDEIGTYKGAWTSGIIRRDENGKI